MASKIYKIARKNYMKHKIEEKMDYKIYKIICEDNTKYEVGEKMPNDVYISSIEICMETQSFQVTYGNMTIDIPSSRIVRWFSKKE